MKSQKVLHDVLRAMFSASFIAELFKPWRCTYLLRPGIKKRHIYRDVLFVASPRLEMLCVHIASVARKE